MRRSLQSTTGCVFGFECRENLQIVWRQTEMFPENHRPRLQLWKRFWWNGRSQFIQKQVRRCPWKRKTTLILSEVQDKLKSTNSLGFRREGNKIQFNFNEEGWVWSFYHSRWHQRNHWFNFFRERDHAFVREKYILRIADKHGWGTVEEYVDSDIADNSEDAARLRSANSRAANKKRQSPYERQVSRELREYSTAYPPGSFFLGEQNSSVVRSLCRNSTCPTTENPFRDIPQ